MGRIFDKFLNLGFLKKCHLVNDLLETKDLILKVYERRYKFRYIIEKGVRGKSNIIHSSYVTQTFNGYEILKKSVKRSRKTISQPS